MKSPGGQGSLLLWTVIVIVAFQLILGSYAAALNALFYANYGPFYDSLSYYNALANMQLDAKTYGKTAALIYAIYYSTVVYPWVLFAPFAQNVEPTRAAGVWIQIFAATCMQFALVFYFFKVRRRTWGESICFSTIFLLIAAVFDPDGGLSDFRMDLLQYLLFTTMMTSYLIARKLQAPGWWALLGITTGLLCLGRATSPVYVAPIFAACAVADLATDGGNRRLILQKWLIASAVAAAVAGWFFVSNFSYLYLYYAILNPDANAHLALSQSVVHLRFAAEHIGPPLLVALLLTAANFSVRSLVELRGLTRASLNWRPLLFSAVPLGYLVFSGAGLNPFVSIVGVSGIMLFLLDPIDVSLKSSGRYAHTLLAGALLLTGCFNAAQGTALNSRNVPIWIPRRDGINRVLDAMTDVLTHASPPRRFTYAVIYSSGLNQELIFNTMFFDRHLNFEGGRVATIAGSQLVPIEMGSELGTNELWSMQPGTNNERTIKRIVQLVNEKVDLLLVPSASTKLPMHVNRNRYVGEITQRLMDSGRWEKIAGPITISPIEEAIILRNRIHDS